jgi:amidase
VARFRNPAHFCGVYGHKPTHGIVPSRGHTPPGVPAVPQEPDLAVVGPLARSAEDLALALAVVAGPDVVTASGWKLELPKPRMTSLSGLRVALWPEKAIAPVSREVADRVVDLGAQMAHPAPGCQILRGPACEIGGFSPPPGYLSRCSSGS